MFMAGLTNLKITNISDRYCQFIAMRKKMNHQVVAIKKMKEWTII